MTIGTTTVSRPFGAPITLVDIRTATGIELQWPVSLMQRETIETEEEL